MDSYVFPPEADQLDSLPFGHGMRRFFRLDDSYTNINHGSYGCPSKYTVEAFQHYQALSDASPDGFYRYELPRHIERVVGDVARYVDADLDAGRLVLVHNATFAVNSILRGWRWRPGDKLLLLSEAYEMVKSVAEFLRDELQVQLVLVRVPFPVRDDELVRLVDETLANESGVAVAVFSHISSVPTAILPVADLVACCRRHRVATVVDGAHAPGQIPLSLRQVDADFYLANGHKWLATCRGAAFLYYKNRMADEFHSALITVGYGQSVEQEFLWPGTDDFSAWLTFSVAIEFRRRLGERRIRDYCHRLAVDAGRRLAAQWSTSVLIPNDDQLGSMSNVLLPLHDVPVAQQRRFVQRLVKRMYVCYKMYVVTFELDERWYCRISAHVYNEPSDFERLSEALLDVKRVLMLSADSADDSSDEKSK